MTSLLTAVAVAGAGLAAGGINSIVGSGTLITFPVLLAIGIAPVTANVSNTIGLVPGSVAGAIGYRRELTGQRDRLLRLGAASVLGGLIGAVLLLSLPAGVFRAVVPVLIVLALVLVVIQPRLSRRLGTGSDATADSASGHAARSEHQHGRLGSHPILLWTLVGLTGVYGGYFGAAQGVLLVAILGSLLDPNLQRVNGMKNVLAALVNGLAGLLFAVFAHPDLLIVAIIAVSSAVGGTVGAQIGRRLSPVVLRAVIVLVGVVALVRFLLS